MTDWSDTLIARQQGYVEGFLAADIPLQDQDQEHGGPLAKPADDETDSEVDLEGLTKADLQAEADRRGIDVPPNANKAELVEALRRA